MIEKKLSGEWRSDFLFFFSQILAIYAVFYL